MAAATAPPTINGAPATLPPPPARMIPVVPRLLEPPAIVALNPLSVVSPNPLDWGTQIVGEISAEPAGVILPPGGSESDGARVAFTTTSARKQ